MHRGGLTAFRVVHGAWMVPWWLWWAKIWERPLLRNRKLGQTSGVWSVTNLNWDMGEPFIRCWAPICCLDFIIFI